MMGSNWRIGRQFEPVECGQITRSVLGRFAGASGDYNPMHIDIDAAKAAGHEDVFAHGMLSMAFLGRALDQWLPQSQLRWFSTRFTAITPLYAVPVCHGVLRELGEVGGEPVARLDLRVVLADGTVTLTGQAEVALPTREAPA